MRSTQIRSRLVKYRASGIDPKSGNRVSWVVWLRGNIKSDARDWRVTAAMGGFTGIKLERVNSDNPRNATKAPNAPELVNSDIAREGLKLLDALMAARKAAK